MIAEELEFQISQYADGTLSIQERPVVDAALQSNAHARTLLAEYQQLNGHLSRLEKAPVVQWDGFADRIAAHLDQADAPTVAGRIGFSFGNWSSRLRLAAAFLIAGTAWMVMHHGKQALPAPVVHSVNGTSDVSGPEPEVATGPGVVDISIHPSELARNKERGGYAEDTNARRAPKVFISGVEAKKDPHVH